MYHEKKDYTRPTEGCLLAWQKPRLIVKEDANEETETGAGSMSDGGAFES